MPRKKLSLVLLGLGLAVLLAGVTYTRPAASAPAVQTAQDRKLPDSVKISANSHKASFPTGITFQFEAKLDDGAPAFNKLELNFRLQGEVATNIRTKKLTANDKTLAASFEYDTQDRYTPPGTHFRYFWTLYQTDGTAYDTAAQDFVYNDERFGFKEVSSGVVTVRWYQGADDFGNAILDKSKATIDKLGNLYQIAPDSPITIHIYPDERSMFTALPPNTQEWVGGQAIPSLGTIVLAIPPGNTREIGRSIPHEISHQVIYQATKNPYNYTPKWLDEGLAVNNQDEVDAFLKTALQNGIKDQNLFSLRVLAENFPTDSEESFRSYGQSVSVVQFILKEYGQEKLGQILQSFKGGVSYDEAVKAGLGITVDELDKKWRDSINYKPKAGS